MSDVPARGEEGELVVDLDLCQGHGRCYSLFPSLFEPGDDDGHAVVLRSHVTGQDHKDAQRAVMECPERAIALRPKD